MADARMTFDEYVAWYSWAKTNFADDAIACHAAAAAAIDALATGSDRDAAAMAGYEAARDEAIKRHIRASYGSRHRYVEWFIWVRVNLGLPYERCHEAAEAALQSIAAGGTEQTAREAATRLLLPPVPQETVPPSPAGEGATPPSANIPPSVRKGYVPLDSHAFVARYDWRASWGYVLTEVMILAGVLGLLVTPWASYGLSTAVHVAVLVWLVVGLVVYAVPIVLAARSAVALEVDSPGIVLRATPFQRGRPVSRRARARGRTDDRTIPWPKVAAVRLYTLRGRVSLARRPIVQVVLSDGTDALRNMTGVRYDRRRLSEVVQRHAPHVVVTIEGESRRPPSLPGLSQAVGFTPWHPTPVGPPGGGGMAIASLILGVVALIAWLLPIVGLPVSVTGIVFGVRGRNSSGRGMAIAGLVMASIGLALALINGGVGAYLAVRRDLGA